MITHLLPLHLLPLHLLPLNLLPLHVGPGFGGPPPFFFLGPLLFLLLIGGLVAMLARRGKLGPPPWLRPQPEVAAFQILAERLARGEIDADEYRDRMSVLREQQARPDDGTLR